MLLPLHVYIHWPFCKSKCPYCDFNSHVRERINEETWLEGYLKEIEYFKEFIKSRSIKTIFFGGGTPSLMSPSTIKSIIDKLYQISPFENIEITIEANPTSSSASKFKQFKEAGINRISIGVQSFSDKDLKFLGREHSYKEAIETIEQAAQIFDNYSFDLIYARPEQTIQEWNKELETALKYVKNHLSLYQLTIEKGTSFYSDFQKKKFEIPDQELALELYELTGTMLKNKGLARYEISNYSLPGKESMHNLGYWKYREYLGIGPGAHSKIKFDQTNLHHIFMIHNPENWLNSVMGHSHGIQQNTRMIISEIALEYLMMGFRLEEGIDLEYFYTTFNKEIMTLLSKEHLDYFETNNFLSYNEKNLKLTEPGKMVMNHIISKLVSA